MSFKDLSERATDATKPKPGEPAKTPVSKTGPEAAGTQTAPDAKTS